MGREFKFRYKRYIVHIQIYRNGQIDIIVFDSYLNNDTTSTMFQFHAELCDPNSIDKIIEFVKQFKGV